jgi:hypothetical protein
MRYLVRPWIYVSHASALFLRRVILRRSPCREPKPPTSIIVAKSKSGWCALMWLAAMIGCVCKAARILLRVYLYWNDFDLQLNERCPRSQPPLSGSNSASGRHILNPMTRCLRSRYTKWPGCPLVAGLYPAEKAFFWGLHCYNCAYLFQNAYHPWL